MKASELKKLIREEIRKVLSEDQVKKNWEYNCTHPSLPRQFKRVFINDVYPDLQSAMDAIHGNVSGKKQKQSSVEAALQWFEKYNSPSSKGPFAQITPTAGGSDSYDADDWPKIIDVSYIKKMPNKDYNY